MKKARKKRPLRGCFIGGVLLLLTVLGGAWWVNRQLGPVSGEAQTVRVRIPAGTGSVGIADLLVQNRLIRDRRVFLYYARLRGDADQLKAGSYRFSRSMSAAQILDRLKQGEPAREDLPVTIPEGFHARQIAHRMEGAGIVQSAATFSDLAYGRTDTFTADCPLPRKGLEGYLFPETYRFMPKTSPEKVIQEMVNTFSRRFYDPNREEIERSPHSLHELVTIASLIEREARVDEERAMIAGVIENRLKRKMRLEIDATVIYALGRHVTRVLYRDLKVDSPYNTYRVRGLPPGPIASPGLPSLLAALRPAKHEYLYYVTISNGAHTFARTKAEHDQNVAKMRAQRRLRAQ